MKKRDIARVTKLLEKIRLRNQILLEFHRLPILSTTNKEIDRELERLEKSITAIAMKYKKSNAPAESEVKSE